MATEIEITAKERPRITGRSSRTPSVAGDPRWLALVVLCAGMLMIVLDATIVNVALPSIQSDLGFSQSSLAWVVNAYLIAFGGALLLAGRLGDLLGQRRVFLAGLAVFTAASLVCGLSIGQEMLVAARFVQGVGGAMTSAVILGMVVTMFTEPRERARAIGIYSFVAAAGASIGLLAGGFLTEALDWHWIFFVNVPIGIVTSFFAVRLIGSDRGIGLSEGADVVGAFLVTGALLLGVYTIIRTTDFGWGSAHTLGFGAAATASLIAFVVRESRIANPLVPLHIFRSRDVSGANVVLLLIFAAMFGMFFLGSLFFQRVLGYDALEIGLAFLPFSVAIGTMSFAFSGPLISRFGARAVLLPSVVLVGTGLVLFARVPVEADYLVDVLPSILLFGIGISCVVAPLTNTLMGSVPMRNAGLGSAINNAISRVGQPLLAAVLFIVISGSFYGMLASRVPGLDTSSPVVRRELSPLNPPRTSDPRAVAAAHDASTDAFRLAMIVAAGLLFAGSVVNFVGIRDRRDGSEAGAADGTGGSPAS